MIIRRIEVPRAAAKKRVAVYCRVSTSRIEQEDSIDMQETAYRALVKTHDDWELTEVYRDVRSGLSAERRPGFMQMIRDAQDKKMDMILCKSVSRFSRNVSECQRYLNLLKDKNIVVAFEKEHLRTDDPYSGLIFSLMEIVAQNESKSISENVKTAIQNRVKAGIFYPSGKMLGYDILNRKLVPNKDAGAIRLIFDMYAEGSSIADICRKLDADGYRRIRSEKQFVPAVIQRILINEIYVGDKLLQKEAPKNYLTKRPDPTVSYVSNYITDDHEAIVSRATWQKVQERLHREEEARKNGFRVTGRSSDLFGKVFCGRCGAPYIRKTRRGKRLESGEQERIRVWCCRERWKGRQGNGCKNPNIKERDLLKAVEGKTFDQILIMRNKVKLKL